MYQIALDGPSGAGKSTIAKRLAHELKIAYLDTGAMYRAVALHMVNHAVDIESEQAVVAALPSIEINVKYEEGRQNVLLNGEDVSETIRRHEISAAASKVSSYLPVREFLVALQQSIAAKQSIVLDGRDIGTAVLPNAKYKFYLTASIEVRAKRRYDELAAKGQAVDYDTLCADIAERDYNDSHRMYSPLRKAADAIEIDSSEMDINDVVSSIMSHIV